MGPYPALKPAKEIPCGHADASSPLLSRRFEQPLANLLNEQHRTVKVQLEQLRLKKSAAKLSQEAEKSKPPNKKLVQALTLDGAQRKRLQQQMQQVTTENSRTSVSNGSCWGEGAAANKAGGL